MNLHKDKDDEDDLAGEMEDFEGTEGAASVANPVQRKEKKGLDFSTWREIAKKEGNPAFHEKEKERLSNETEVEPKEKKMASNGLSRQVADRGDAKLQSVAMSNSVLTIKGAQEVVKDTSHLASANKKENHVQTMQYPQDGVAESLGSSVVEKVSTWQNGSSKQVDLKMGNTQKSHTASSFSVQALVGGEENSLQSQIDAENRARLASMSADELAEAQAEIMAKLNPKLIDALKKRGEARGKRQKSSLTDVTGSASDGMKHEEALPKISENTVSHEPMEIDNEDSLKKDKVSADVSPDKGGIWNAWSKRVERVRDLRFSLDGNSIGFCMESDIGKCTGDPHSLHIENADGRFFFYFVELPVNCFCAEKQK